MKVRFHSRFKKAYQRLRANEREKFNERLATFMQDPFLQILNNHPLRGKYAGCRSINISGDLRAIYRLIGADIAYFITIGSHNDLYS